MATETFLATFGLIGLRLVELHGIDPHPFAIKTGLAPVTRDARTRLPSNVLDKLFERAATLIPNPAFALRAAECWHPSHLGTLGYAWLSSGSLRTALKRMARFTRIIGQRMSSRCIDNGEALHFIYDHGRGDTLVGYVMADFDLSLVMSMCRLNLGAPLNPDAVSLRRPKPANPRPYEEFFGCPVSFGASDNGIVLPRHIADTPLPTSNHELAATFDAILTRQLSELGGSDLSSRCKAYLLDQLTSGEPTEVGLAKAMYMSPRTLQRKLGELGTHYRNLLESVRYDLALRYLDDPQKSVTEITFLLGFSEQSAFSRAFKRWNGKAPSAYRGTR
jgi:AraC-like DNA-binding protein